MTDELFHRLLAGAQTGSLVLTRSEAVHLLATISPRATIALGDHLVEIRSIPWHVLPDTPAELPELDPWRRMAHESMVEGLIDGEDQRRLFEVADRREAEHQAEARRLVDAGPPISPEALAELRELFGQTGDEHA